ncbi:hypothetical protein LG201_05715 [Methylobacillus gramineus]|uniref:hypothetical protein n=1 Tax=Methylobacillus gramineus TaxID=755169 RepID=UPI001CFFDF10|nr:hypothetical protein [Methylobacillus gramineus]MCB5184695.1 hypothetical protein [Methylobacillus gramineus]
MKMNETSSSYIKAKSTLEKALDEKNAVPEPVAGERKHVTARRLRAAKKVAQAHSQELSVKLPMGANKNANVTKL